MLICIDSVRNLDTKCLFFVREYVLQSDIWVFHHCLAMFEVAKDGKKNSIFVDTQNIKLTAIHKRHC